MTPNDKKARYAHIWQIRRLPIDFGQKNQVDIVAIFSALSYRALLHLAPSAKRPIPHFYSPEIPSYEFYA